MPTNPLTIVPVKLDPLINEMSSIKTQKYSSEPSCVIKTTSVEISFFNSVDDRIIQTIMKELNSR